MADRRLHILRSIRMRVRMRAMDSPRYWKFLKTWRRVRNLSTDGVVHARARSSRILLLSVGVADAAGRALISLLFSLAVLLGSQSSPHWGPAFRWLSGIHPHIVVRFGRWLGRSALPTFDASPLLTAALAVAGTFVAVYFATITFVVSTSYKDATKLVRDQVLLHRGTDWYSRFFAHGVAFTALALFLPVAGRTPTHLTLVLAGLVGALVVLSFTRIWATLFMLLEPTSLFSLIHKDLRRSFARAARLSRRRRVSGTAVRYSDQKITDGLQTLSDLVTLVLDREFERAGDRGISASFDSRISLTVGHVQAVWAEYAHRKPSIATLPGWSRRRQETKDWFLASDSEIGIALATRTSLAPQDVPDGLWVERWLSGLVTRLLDGRSLRSLDRAVSGLPALSQVLAGSGQFDEARLWHSAFTFPPRRSLAEYAERVGGATIADDHADKMPSQLRNEEHFRTPDEASAHNLAEAVVFEVIEMALGYVLYLQRVVGWLPTAASSVLDRKSPILLGTAIAQAAADTREVLDNEREIEGKRVTPDSAIVQHVARVAAATIVDELEEVLSFCERELAPWAVRVGASNTLAAGAALSRMLELTAKLDLANRTARAALAALNKAHVETDDRWPNTALDGVAERMQELRDGLELPIARLAATVAPMPDPEKPDHFGWAYHQAYDDLFQRVLSMDPGDPAEFRQKVVLVYWAGDLATRRLLTTIRRQGQRVINAYVSEPNVRFLQVSGIALLLSKVTGNDALFEPFAKVWSDRLATPEAATETLARAAATLVSVGSLFGLTAAALQRSSRETAANGVLEDLGVPRRLYDLMGFDPPGAEPKPPPNLSDEARELLMATRASHFEGMFYAKWLRPTALAKGAALPTALESELPRLGLDLEDDDDD